ncbi:SusC/RagA family TonB-linked outer membrane protein [Chitinophaga horti]|uniref:SusC/RagA family TonB-linked outer membrane protein n=1 Tax=Chitinophaga horti TaxID=2920382 RepID=A0ABY6IZG2_9BACT|nr:SusC/RagA family TonB-linked outer membrane protein [Chitinophaga horti]UYQ92668.1 SusC/RagA family TonB-linked outer membrane protein [Chitinophaga horti]
MITTRIMRAILLCPLFLALPCLLMAQTKAISGSVKDEKGAAVPGATVQVKGTNTGTTTNAEGDFKLNAPNAATTLIVSFLGYTTQEVDISSNSTVAVVLAMDNTTLTDVVVVGYGTTRKKDLTGAVTSLKTKDFNRGIVSAPDQLIQGKVSGLMIVNNSGAPGGAATVRIRGNASVRSGNQPLYVVDGVPLDGRTARPNIDANGLGQTPDANPLNFINSFDIASIEVLKDASATAIYGSRGSNGVIIITTKKGAPGTTKVDVSYSVGTSNMMKNLDVLSPSEYRKALDDYNLAGGDYGGNTDAMDAITRNALTNNINVGVSGGNENGRYRASFGLLDQQGIVIKSGLKKYTANLNGQYNFLESKRLGLDFNLSAAHTREQLAPITNNAGFTGSLIGQALQWNPTQPLYKTDGSLNILGNGDPINPLAMSKAFNDNANISYLLGSISPYVNIADGLQYRFLYSINRQIGIRRAEIKSFININGVNGFGQAYYGNTELTSQLFTHTLSYNKEFKNNLNLSAVVGYEYQKFEYRGTALGALGFSTDELDYTNILQNALQSNTFMNGFQNPSSEIQSVFGRVTMNLQDKYLLTGTLRADGSSKFGANNKYGYFPSFAAKWNISNEAFLKGNTFFNQLAVRVGWGITGNQEFPAGAAQEQYVLGAGGGAGLSNVANPDLKWESSQQLNAGIDFSLADNRIYGSVDYFHKKTTNLLFNFPAIQPAPASNYWINLPGNVLNSGVELAIKGDVVRGKDWQWTLGANAAFMKNELRDYAGPIVLTGSISGQGVSGATIQRLVSGHPLNTFYVRDFQGFDDNGQGVYAEKGSSMYYLGDPNPDQLLGITSELNYKRWALNINMNGAFGHHVYNNTANTVLPIGNLGSRNIAASLLGTKEALSNPITTSSRYLEKADFMKLTNATLSYNLGNIGRNIKNVNLFVTGQNLFVLTGYSGFDPEVNTDKSINGVTSFGIEYSPYPTARTILFGLNFSL